jgi:hypothetical protein
MATATTQVGRPRREGTDWLVPSSSGEVTYYVEQTAFGWRCSCPNSFYRRRLCKHAAACIAMELDGDTDEA